MKKNNDPKSTLDQRLQKARPSDISEARASELLALGLDKAAKEKTKLSLKWIHLGSGLTAALALALVTLVLLPQQTLTITLGKKSSHTLTSSSSASYSSLADCAYSDFLCDDVFLPVLSKIEYQYSFADGITMENQDDHVYSLAPRPVDANFAQMLADQLDVQGSLQTTDATSKTNLHYTIGNGAGETVTVYTSSLGQSFAYNNDRADDWGRCHIPSATHWVDCSKVQYQHFPSESEALVYAKAFLAKLGIHSDTDKLKLANGDYILEAASLDQGDSGDYLSVIASLFVDGVITGQRIEFAWQWGSYKPSFIFGSLYTLHDEGSFGTLPPQDVLDQMNQNGLEPGYISGVRFSENTFMGMSAERRAQLDAEARALKPGEKISIKLNVTAAVQTKLGLHDANNKAWIVPGYNFYDRSGYIGSAYSLGNEHIKAATN
jgi:hypothetical protein